MGGGWLRAAPPIPPPSKFPALLIRTDRSDPARIATPLNYVCKYTRVSPALAHLIDSSKARLKKDRSFNTPVFFTYTNFYRKVKRKKL
jgi:hypothetical protein